MACNAQDLINAAYANGYAKLSERDLQAAAVAATCALTGGGSGTLPGGGTSGSGAPSAPPTGNQGWYYDSTNFDFYVWNAATSHWDLLLDL